MLVSGIQHIDSVFLQIVVFVQLLSCVWVFAAPWTAACQASLSSTIFHSLLKFTFVESVMLFNHLILCHTLSFGHQFFPASASFPMSWLFTSCGQRTGASASASVLPMNIQDWFPLGSTGLISLLSKGLSRVFSSTKIWRHQFFYTAFFYCPALTSVYDYWKKP